MRRMDYASTSVRVKTAMSLKVISVYFGVLEEIIMISADANALGRYFSQLGGEAEGEWYDNDEDENEDEDEE
jgi:hypothetical protein